MSSRRNQRIITRSTGSRIISTPTIGNERGTSDAAAHHSGSGSNSDNTAGSDPNPTASPPPRKRRKSDESKEFQERLRRVNEILHQSRQAPPLPEAITINDANFFWHQDRWLFELPDDALPVSFGINGPLDSELSIDFMLDRINPHAPDRDVQSPTWDFGLPTRIMRLPIRVCRRGDAQLFAGNQNPLEQLEPNQSNTNDNNIFPHHQIWQLGRIPARSDSTGTNRAWAFRLWLENENAWNPDIYIRLRITIRERADAENVQSLAENQNPPAQLEHGLIIMDDSNFSWHQDEWFLDLSDQAFMDSIERDGIDVSVNTRGPDFMQIGMSMIYPAIQPV